MSAEHASEKPSLDFGAYDSRGAPADGFRLPLEQALEEGLGGLEIPLSSSDRSGEDWAAVLEVLDKSLVPYEADAYLHRSRDLMQQVLDTLPLAVYWKDRDSHYLGGNQLFARDAGLGGIGELAGLSDFDLPWRGKAEKCRDEDFQIMKGVIPQIDVEELRQSPGGEKRWFRVRKGTLHDQEGKVVGILGSYQDITHEKVDPARDGLAPVAGGRVLLAGGSISLRESLRKIVEKAGCQVETAGGRAAAQAALRFGLFDLVLADGDDGQLDVLDLCRELGSEADPGAGVPFLILSAHPTEDVAALCREAGGSELLAKPPVEHLLRRALSRWLQEVDQPAAS